MLSKALYFVPVTTFPNNSEAAHETASPYIVEHNAIQGKTAATEASYQWMPRIYLFMGRT